MPICQCDLIPTFENSPRTRDRICAYKRCYIILTKKYFFKHFLVSFFNNLSNRIVLKTTLCTLIMIFFFNKLDYIETPCTHRCIHFVEFRTYFIDKLRDAFFSQAITRSLFTLVPLSFCFLFYFLSSCYIFFLSFCKLALWRHVFEIDERGRVNLSKAIFEIIVF